MPINSEHENVGVLYKNLAYPDLAGKGHSQLLHK
jgi:hypothetical protein